MNRREFLAKSSASALLLSSLPIVNLFGANLDPGIVDAADADPYVRKEFVNLLQWMEDKGWTKFLRDKVGLDVSPGMDLNGLTEDLGDGVVGKFKDIPGLDDFGGRRLIHPGYPSLSLVYHVLASPRVKPAGVTYPGIAQLDAGENYAYHLGEIADPNTDGLVPMVLAYEYRPAYKVPPFAPQKRNGDEYAQLVFSRTGMGRCGDRAYNWSGERRCFTNKPKADKDDKHIAVVPARYGLFWCRVVDGRQDLKAFSIMNENFFDDHKHKYRHFVVPVRKICDTQERGVQFGEYHVNEKLKKLALYQWKGKSLDLKAPVQDLDKPPFKLINSTDDSGKAIAPYHNVSENFVQLERFGSSVILGSVEAQLAKPVISDGKIVCVKVPEGFSKFPNWTNRRYSALKIQNDKGNELLNIIVSDVIERKNKRLVAHAAPKNAPLFLNIKYEVEGDDETNAKITHIDGHTFPGSEEFNNEIKNGGYYAQVFKDGICDGCITARVYGNPNKTGTPVIQSYDIEPAFSVVTAPDFFPLIDSLDIRAHYIYEGADIDQDFEEGGTINLSGQRLKGNPEILDPFDTRDREAQLWEKGKSKTYNTIMAVTSVNLEGKGGQPTNKFRLNFERDYQASTFLPDTATGVFYPGWDATYSGERKDPFFATFGLGSPYAEDMKLCAAGNGMWPVTSPDAARTFQGSIEPTFGRRPTTSIPLLDDEIGRNINSPGVKEYGREESYGWDGEQGPFLQLVGNKVVANFTDINRADYIHNLIDPEHPGFDMSVLRKLESEEVIRRMDCLRLAVRATDHKKIWKSKLWLIAAEKVEDWGSGMQNITCLPKDSVFDKVQYKEAKNAGLTGPGYFFVLARVKFDKKPKDYKWDANDKHKKRRYVNSRIIWLCQASAKGCSFIKVNTRNNTVGNWKWREIKFKP